MSDTIQTTQTTPRTIDQATKDAAQRWNARKAARLAKKAARKTHPAHLAAMARKVASAADATRHYSQANDLMADAIISRM